MSLQNESFNDPSTPEKEPIKAPEKEPIKAATQALTSVPIEDLNQDIANVLIVDDRKENLIAFEDILQTTNAHIVCVTNADEMLKTALEHQFACVLMNVHLGADSGFEIMKRFKQLKGQEHTPFMFITAQEIAKDPFLEAYQQGAADFLFMPVMAEVLTSKVNAFISVYQSQIQLRQEITRRQVVEDKLIKMAQFDALTGLANRYAFTDYLNRAIAKSSRSGISLAVLFIDLDHFKLVNDSYGHDIGDALLTSVSKRLLSSIRDSDLVARLGGDEFAIIAEGFQNTQNLTILAEKVLASQSPVHLLKTHRIFTSISIGISVHEPSQRQTAEQLLKNADIAMYEAKALGRNNYRFFSKILQDKAVERLELERDLKTALANDEFELFFQPIVDQQHHISSMEALLRWHRPGFGDFPPEKFITTAEDNGLIVDIGRWVLQQTCEQAKKWQNLPHFQQPLTIAANVSIAQLMDDSFSQTVDDCFKQSGIKPELILLELTENKLMDDPKSSIDVMKKIQHHGTRFAIDDFGTGHSSLNYLLKLPVDVLKIDQAFVSNLEHDSNARHLVRTMVSMAHSLSLKVVAEGVETRYQSDFLKSIACDYMQGYYFCRPVTAAQLADILSQGPQIHPVGEP